MYEVESEKEEEQQEYYWREVISRVRKKSCAVKEGEGVSARWSEERV